MVCTPTQWSAGDAGAPAPVPRSNTTSQLSAAELAEEYPVYPVNLRVRNTFLEFPVTRPESLDEYLQLRQIRSAPGSRVDAPDERNTEASWQQPVATTVAPAATANARDVISSSCPVPARLELASMLLSTDFQAPVQPQPPYHGTVCNQPPMPHPGALQPVPPTVPTRGSVMHGMGQCKPCAFAWKGDGCGNGVECPFCHLCDPCEKKRRSKEKKANIRAQHVAGSSAPSNVSRLQNSIGSSFRHIFS